MKKAVHNTIKLLLILTIFIGLQGRVIARYLETIHQNQKSEIGRSGVVNLKAAVVRCNLQCYVRDFKVLDIPGAVFLLIFIIPILISKLPELFFQEKPILQSPARLSSLRAPPVF